MTVTELRRELKRADEILRERWGEYTLIAQRANCSFGYANKVISGRRPCRLGTKAEQVAKAALARVREIEAAAEEDESAEALCA